MNQSKSYIRRGFFVGFVLAAIVGVATSAFAKFEQHSAGACKISHYSNGSAMELIYDWDGRVFNFSDRTAYFLCEISDTDRFLKQNITTLKVHVNDGSTTKSVRAQACITSFDGTGGACGSAAVSGNSFTGEATLRPSLSQWSSSTASDFGFLQVQLPSDTPPAGVDTSTFHGYFFSGN